jgi:hypothetical protein
MARNNFRRELQALRVTQLLLPRLRAAKGDPLHGGPLMRISLRRDAAHFSQRAQEMGHPRMGLGESVGSLTGDNTLQSPLKSQ